MKQRQLIQFRQLRVIYVSIGGGILILGFGMMILSTIFSDSKGIHDSILVMAMAGVCLVVSTLLPKTKEEEDCV